MTRGRNVVACHDNKCLTKFFVKGTPGRGERFCQWHRIYDEVSAVRAGVEDREARKGTVHRDRCVDKVVSFYDGGYVGDLRIVHYFNGHKTCETWERVPKKSPSQSYVSTALRAFFAMFGSRTPFESER